MSEEINLLGHPGQFGESRFPKIIRIFSIGFLSLVSFLAILFFFLKSQSELPALTQQESQLVSQLNAQNVKLAKFMFVRDRLTNTSKILSARPKLAETIAVLQKDIPNGVTVESLSTDNVRFTLRIGSTSVSAIHEYTQKMEKNIKNLPFKNLKLDNLSYDQRTNRYSLTIRGDIK